MAKKKDLPGLGLNKFQDIKQITILPELKAFIPPLSLDSKNLLKESIQKDGFREAFDLWQNGNEYILIDGHNRYDISLEIGDDNYKTKIHHFANIEEVKKWMMEKQLGRRNLTDAQRTYFLGLYYNSEKGQKGGNIENMVEGSTAEKIAKKNSTSVRTVKNSGEYADALEKNITPELKKDILDGNVKVKKADVQIISKSDKTNISTPDDIRSVADEIRKKKTIKHVKEKPSNTISVDLENSIYHVLDDKQYSEDFIKLQGLLEPIINEFDNNLIVSVINNINGLMLNQTDRQKLVKDNYKIFRADDTHKPKIKILNANGAWEDHEADFSSKAKRNVRLNEILLDKKNILG